MDRACEDVISENRVVEAEAGKELRQCLEVREP